MSALTLVLMSMVFMLLLVNGALYYFLKQSRLAMNAMLALIVLSLNMLAYTMPLYEAQVSAAATINAAQNILSAGVYLSLLIQLLVAMSLLIPQSMVLIHDKKFHISWLFSCLLIAVSFIFFKAYYFLSVAVVLTAMLAVITFFQLRLQVVQPQLKFVMFASSFFLACIIWFSYGLSQSAQFSQFALTSYNLGMTVYVFASLMLICSQHRNSLNEFTLKTERKLDLLLKQKMSAQNLLAAEHDAYQQLEVEMQTRNFELEVTMRELQDQNNKLEQLNTQDALTGVKNRRYFEQRISSEFRRSRREKAPLSLIMVDIDKFKSINDNYGHLVGDQAIRQTARLMQQQLRRVSDCICRYGGEEFAIILPMTDSQGAKQFAENIRSRLNREQLVTSDVSLTITASFGVATLYANDNNKVDELISLADKALYQAKQQGRNRTVCAEQNIVLALNINQS